MTTKSATAKATTADLEPGTTPRTERDESPIDQLPTTRRAILNLIKRQGPLDALAVAEALALTPAAVRLQLARLEEDGLLVHHDEVPEGAGRGRPRHVYELTSAAEALYPKRYGDLTTELLGYLGGPDASQVDDLFEQRRLAPRRRRAPPHRQSPLRRAGCRADCHSRRGRLPRRGREAARRQLAHHRAQLRHPHRRTRVLSGVHERARLYPRRAPRGHGATGCAPDGRRARVRLRGQPAGVVVSAARISRIETPSTSWISLWSNSMRSQADLDDELVDRSPVLALQDVDGHNVAPHRTDAAGDEPQGAGPIGECDPDDVAGHGGNVRRSM